MLLRITVFVMMALGLLGFGTVAWLSVQPATPAQAKENVQPKVAVLAVARDVTAGQLLKPDDIIAREVLKTKIPEGATADTAENRHQLTGSMIRRRLARGEVLLPDDLLRPGDHGFLAAVLGAGMRAVTVGVDAITGTAGLIWPGDHVDVLLTHQIDDPRLPVGRRIAAETVLNDVRVIAIDQQLVQGATPGTGESKPATTVTLEVTGQQSERVSVASRLGKLSLVVRSAKNADSSSKVAGADGTATSDGADQERKTITWAGDVSPALSIDPVPAAAPPVVVRVWNGIDKGQEFKF
jgi:pilus assembly protein CpaB